MYVGKKDHRAGAGVLDETGWTSGELYALVPANPSNSSEAAFTSERHDRRSSG